jgi:molecular chaperone GrpE
MSDVTSSLVAPGPAGGPVLNPAALAAVLEEFRGWFEQAAELGELPTVPADERPPVDLHTLVGQFTALRHEINLQTRAGRAQLEQGRQTLEAMQQAMLAMTEGKAAQDRLAGLEQDDCLRPLLKTLIELADTFRLAGRQLQRGRQALDTMLQTLEHSTAPVVKLPRLVRLAVNLVLRLSGRPSIPATDDGRERRRQAAESRRRLQELLEAQVSGYEMSLRRLERTLSQHGLEAIASVGLPFDPERMEVIEAVTDSGRPAGEVIEEVRTGYLWRGRVFRFTQVRVARA